MSCSGRTCLHTALHSKLRLLYTLPPRDTPFPTHSLFDPANQRTVVQTPRTFQILRSDESLVESVGKQLPEGMFRESVGAVIGGGDVDWYAVVLAVWHLVLAAVFDFGGQRQRQLGLL